MLTRINRRLDKQAGAADGATACLPEKRRKWVWPAVLIFLFLVFYLFNRLAPLMSDDYNYAFNFSNGKRVSSVADLFSSLVRHYEVSNGRYATHFIAQLMLWAGKPLFNVLNSMMAVLLLVGLCRLTSDRQHDVLLLCLWSGLLIVLLPTLGQVMFWLTGACNYLWGTTLIIWSMVPFRRMLTETGRRMRWRRLVYMLPGFFVMGTVSENGSPAAILFMVLCCAYQLVKRRRVPVWMWFAVALSAVGFLTMLLSPASLARNARSLSGAPSFFAKYTPSFINCVTLFLQHELLPASVFLCLFAYAMRVKISRDRLALSIMLFVCGVASHFAMTATGYYPLRAMTVSLLMILAAGALLLSALRGSALDPLFLGSALALCLFAGMLCMQAAPQTYDRFRQAQARERQMIEAQASGDLDVVTFNISSKTKFDVFYDMIDLTYDPDYFSNAVFARYYGLRSVVINDLQ